MSWTLYKDLTFDGIASIIVRVLSQDDEPTSGTGATQLKAGAMCFWIDTNDANRLYVCYNQAGTVKTVELT